MVNERVRSLVDLLADGHTATGDQFRGLTEDEIREVENDQPAPLAEAYRCFLTLIGGGAGEFMRGSDFFYPRLLGLLPAARELLAENSVPFELTPSDRVIFMHQGYQFAFLRGDSPDPEVWFYGEGCVPAGVNLSHPRFTDWLAAEVQWQLRLPVR